MISASAEYYHGNIKAFTVKYHGAGNVCAAVSLLVINTVNSIEKFTDEPIVCEYEEDGGYIRLELTEPENGDGVKLLLDSMMLGLRSIRDKYPSEIEINEREVNQ